MTSALVVDRDCQAMPDLVRRIGLQVVPLTVVVDGVPHAEGVDLAASGITEAWRRGAELTTSSPSPGDMLEAYDAAGDPEAAVTTMATYVVEQAAGRPLRIGVGHLGVGDLAAELEASLRERLVAVELVRYVVGLSIAVYTGLGTVGCVFAGA